MFYVVSALANQEKFATSKHKQLIGWFNKTFIKEGILPTIYKDMLVKSFEYRTESDYGKSKPIATETVQQLYDDMLVFTVAIRKMVEEQ